MQTAFRHFIGPSMPRLTSRSFSEALASYVRLFTQSRRSMEFSEVHIQKAA